MKIFIKDVSQLGFKGSSIFADSKWSRHYYATVESAKRVFIVDALENSVSHFDLTAEDLKEFKDGSLGLTPLNCCNASGGRSFENPVMDFYGDFEEVFENKKKFIAYLKRLLAKKRCFK